MLTKRLLAYIDEAGAKTSKDPQQRYFIMSAVVMQEERKREALALLANIRAAVNVRIGMRLHWRKIRSEKRRKIISQMLGAADYLTISHVVVLHDYHPDHMEDEHHAYMLTLQYLLERLSWLARDRSRKLLYCVERVARLTEDKFRSYLAEMKTKMPNPYAASSVRPTGSHLHSSGMEWGSLGEWMLSVPQKTELLQLADIAASSTLNAFMLDEYRWIENTKSRLYRYGKKPNHVYGVKMHPWNDAVKAAFPWVDAL